jgi:hypothetical protein
LTVLRPLIAAVAIASIASLVATAVGQAADGPCYIEVDGQVYLDKICNIERKFGIVSIGTGESSREQYFAYVEVGESPDRAKGYWNGPSAENRAHVGLETLTRQGNCWSNARAKVCGGAR